MVNNYRPRTSEAAFSTSTAPITYPRDWNPYPMYVLREDVGLDIGGGTGSVGSINSLSADRVTDGFARVSMTTSERNKLAGIAPGANVVSDQQIRQAFGELLQAGPNVGIVFYYDKAADKLSSVVTGGAQGGRAVDVFGDPSDADVLLWNTDTLAESNATLVSNPSSDDELIWTAG